MNKQILYDRDISVTFYRKSKKVETLYKTISPGIYSEQTVNGRTVLSAVSAKKMRAVTYDPRQQNEYMVGAGEGEEPPLRRTGLIEFFQGDYRDVFIGTVRNAAGAYEDQYKRIRARGSVYTFRTEEDMLHGVRPDGTPFQTGDKIRIVENGARWNVYVEGSTSAAYTESTIAVPAQVIELKNTPNGLKPDITLSINLLPNQNCYGATLRIKNFNLDPIDIRSWDKMVITAGYRTGKKVIYNCPIFSSYIESPNPDGVTVFEGLTVGSAEDVLTDKYLVIDFVQEEMTLERLIRDVAKGISDSIEVELSLGKVYTQQMLKVTKQRVYAQNGMAVLNWLQTFVSEYVAAATGNETTVLTQLIDGKLSVIAINGVNEKATVMDNVVNLDMVTSASFAGTALTAIAPWNPALRPGDLFYMPPQFINGSKLPNSISTSDYRNDENLYRALTISVEFASVDETNKMTILAVPAQWAGRLPDDRTTEMPADVYGEIVTEIYQRTNEPIEVGDPDKEEVNKLRDAKQIEKTGVDFIDNSETILTLWTNWTTLKQEEYTGSCISMIARYYLYLMPGGPSLVEGKGNGRERSYYEEKKWLTDNNLDKAVTYFQNTGISAQYLWWPLITAATYWRRKKDTDEGVSHNWTKIYLNNPNFIEAGKSVYIPNFPSGTWRNNRSQLAKLKDIWKDAYNDYKDLYGDSCKIWRAMYYYLGGTDELN